MREPSNEEEDWLLEEEVLLLEMVECGRLKDVACSKEGTAMDALVLASVNNEHTHTHVTVKRRGICG